MESSEQREPWYKGKLVGQKAPVKPKDIWAICIHLQNGHHVRDLARAMSSAAWKRASCPLSCRSGVRIDFMASFLRVQSSR